MAGPKAIHSGEIIPTFVGCDGLTELQFTRLSREAAKPKSGIAVIVPYDPDPQRITVDVVEEVIGKSIQIAPSQTAGIKMKKSRIDANLLKTHLELCEKVVTQLIRNGVILLENFIQIALNSTVKSSQHDVLNQKPADRK